MVVTKQTSTITCDFEACNKPPILLDKDMEVPAAYWKTLVLTNAKNEPKVFCSKGCLFQYLQTDFVACEIPGV